MVQKRRGPSEALPTLLTFVWLLSHVPYLVSLKTRQAAEGVATLLTFVPPPSHVGLPIHPEMTVPASVFPTHPLFRRIFTTIYSAVELKPRIPTGMFTEAGFFTLDTISSLDTLFKLYRFYTLLRHNTL